MNSTAGKGLHLTSSVQRRLEASSLGLRLARGAFWSLVGAVISRVLGVLASVLVARMLGREGFGELGVIQSTVGMFGTFAGFGLGLTATKYVAEFREKDAAKAGRIMALSERIALFTGGLTAVALIVLAPWLAARTLAAPRLSGLLQIGTALLFFNALTGVQTGALAGFEAFKTIAWVNFLAGAAAFPLMVGGVYVAGLDGAVWGLVASTVLNWVLNQFALRREAARACVVMTAQGCMQEWPVLWRFSLPALLSSLMMGPANWVCYTFIVNQPGGYGEMGVFNAANQWRSLILYLPSILVSVVLPILASLSGSEDVKRYRRVLRSSVLACYLAALMPAIAIATLSRLIMSAYGATFAVGSTALVVLMVATVLNAGLHGIGQVYSSRGWMWWGAVLNTVWSAVLIAATWLLRGHGAVGLAGANVIAFAVHTAITVPFTYLVVLHGMRERPLATVVEV